MNNFNTHDYDFLLKTLQQGSLIFKAEALKRLLMLAINDKKQFSIITKQVLDYLPQFYLQDKEDINMNATMLLSQIIINSTSKQIQWAISENHIDYVIRNLGHGSKPNIRKLSHTCLLSFLKNFKNFNSLSKSYVQFGFNNQSSLIQQKSINSFQSILILELKKFNWEANQSKNLFQNIILKVNDQNTNVAKAASQCLLSACKIMDAKSLISKLSIGFLSKLKIFLEDAMQSNNSSLFQITPEDIQNLINGKKKPIEHQRKTIQVPPMINTIQQKDFQTIKVNNTQRRLDKIRSSIKKNETKKPFVNEKQAGATKLLGNLTFQGSIKEKTQAVQELLFKIQANKDKPEFQSVLRQIIPQLTKLLKDSNPKIVGTTLRILQITIQDINSSDKHFNGLLSVIVQKLGDQKISIRQTVSKVIRQLIKKTKKGIWIHQLLENMKKNTNTFLRDQTLSLIHYIFQQNKLQDIDYPISDLLDSIVIYSDDPKTKIKIRTLDCLSQIVFVSKQVEKYNQILKGKIPAIFYQMYTQKLNRLFKQDQKKNADQEKHKKVQSFASTYRSAYNQRNNEDKANSQNGDQDDDKLNISVQLVKKRVSLLKKPRNLMSTQQTSSLDNHSQRTIQRTLDRTIQDVQVILPSLYKKTTTNHFISRANSKKSDYSPNKTAEKVSDYLSKEDLQPLNDPQRQYKQILNQLKSADWKILFQSTNKLRRIIEFNPDIIKKSHSTSIHSLILEILSLIQNLRSSVSKNALICLNQLLLILERQIDPQLQIVFQKLIKKSADTNVFISAQVQKCLNHLGLCASPYKFLDKVSQYKDSKSIPIKQACVSSLIYIKQQDSIRQKQYIKLAQCFSYFLTDGQQQIRNKAKIGIVQLCNSLSDWYRALRGKINPSFFKSICQLMTKSNSIIRDNQQRHQTIRNSPKKRQLVSKDEYSTIKSQKSSSIRQTPLKIQLIQQPRKKVVKVSQFPSQFQQIQGYLQQCNSSDWKKRMDSINKVKALALAHQNQFMQFRAANHFIDCVSKQILEPNVKISINAMEVFQQVYQPLKILVQNNLGILCNSLFNALSSNKTQVKQKAQICTKTLMNDTQIQVILQHLCHGIMYSLPKSRIYLLNILKDKVQDIHDKRKQLLFKYVFPLMNKLMEQYKSELIPHAVSIFYKLYQSMGNHMFSHLTKFKEVRELIDR